MGIFDSMSDSVVSNIANLLFSALIDWINNIMIGIIKVEINIVNSITMDFWDNYYVSLILDFGTWIAWGVFAVSFIVLLCDLAEERSTGQPIDWGMVFSSISKTICFILFARWIAIWSLKFIGVLTDFLGAVLDYGRMKSGMSGIYSGVDTLEVYTKSALILVVAIVLCACCWIFIYQSFKRFGNMFIHVMQAPLYVPDIIRGDTKKIGEWLRQMIAISVTYGFQYMCFYLGATLLMDGQVLTALPFWIVFTQIPKILQQFGWSTGTTGKFSQVVGQLSSLIRF